MSKNFIIKIYTPVEALLLAVISLVAGSALFIYLDKSIHLSSWSAPLLHTLLLLIVLAFGWVGQRLATITVNLEVNKDGIFLTGYRSLFGIGQQNESIYWSDVKKWTYQEGQLTSHDWSPTTFSIQQNNRKKRTFYIVNNNHNIKSFEVFLNHFQFFAYEMNLKNQGIARIKQGVVGKPPKIVAVLISLLFIGASLFMAWWLLWKPLPADWDFPKGFNVLYVILLSSISIWTTKMMLTQAWSGD